MEVKCIKAKKELLKVVLGSELAIKLETGGYKVRRFYRNVKVDNLTYDLFVEYVDNYNDIKQILVDINLDENFNIFKYDKIEEKIEKSTIPFFEVPKILVVTKNNKDIKVPDKLDLDIDFVDINLSKLFKVI